MSNWQDLACNYKWVDHLCLAGSSGTDPGPMLFKHWPTWEKIQSLTAVHSQQWQKWGIVANGTEERSPIRVTVIFNTDSNKVLTGNKATLPYRHFAERWGVKQMAILLAMGQDMNAQCSPVAKGATITLGMHTGWLFCGSQDIRYFCTGLQLLWGSMQLWQAQLSILAMKPGRAQRLVMRQMRALTTMPCSKRCQEHSTFT